MADGVYMTEGVYMADVPMTDEELFPHVCHRAYLNILPELDKENVRAWKRIVNAVQDRVTLDPDGSASIRGVLSPMQLRAVAAIAAFNHSSLPANRPNSDMFWMWRMK
jgi:hypothetical protein